MNKQEFLELTPEEQNAMVSEAGVLLISFDQGDSSISFYRLQHLFVKTTSKDDGYRHVEVQPSQQVFNFSEFSNDPAGAPCK